MGPTKSRVVWPELWEDVRLPGAQVPIGSGATFKNQDCKLAEKDCCVHGEGTLLTVCPEPVCNGFSTHGAAGCLLLGEAFVQWLLLSA